MTEKLKVIKTRREVIENCLLASITAGGQVAIVLSQADLTLLIDAMSHAPLTPAQSDLLGDIKTLWEKAFADH